MKLRPKKDRKSPKLFKINYKNSKNINLKCPYCDYKSNKTFNYERHIFINHDNNKSCFKNIPNSLLNYEKMHNNKRKQRDNNFHFSISIEETLTLFRSNKDESLQNKDFLSFLSAVFNKENHLNKYDIDIGTYYLHESKIIGKRFIFNNISG